jgi:ribonuclease HI
MYELWFDGLFRGTKAARKAGLMCFGWLIYRNGRHIAEGYGITARGQNATSNIAEYLGLIDGLEILTDISHHYEPVRVIGDSKVVIDQLRGRSRIRTQRVLPLHNKVRQLAQLLEIKEWKWLPRRHNKAADRLTRLALREFRADPQGVERAWSTVLADNAQKRDKLHILGGMMVYADRALSPLSHQLG